MSSQGQHAPDRLKKRSEFLAVQKNQKKWISPSVIVQVMERTNSDISSHDVRVGFTVTKKMGGAVTRNRIKRRLREAIKAISGDIQPNYDLVLIGRQPAAICPYNTLHKDLRWCLKRLEVLKP